VREAALRKEERRKNVAPRGGHRRSKIVNTDSSAVIKQINGRTNAIIGELTRALGLSEPVNAFLLPAPPRSLLFSSFRPNEVARNYRSRLSAVPRITPGFRTLYHNLSQ